MNIMVFCSNPVDGGTARIFYETVIGLREKLDVKDRLFPCINKHNPVNIYHKIDGLIELPIRSAETAFPGLYGGNLLVRAVKRICRTMKYRPILNRNILKIERFIKKNNIDAVIIHNGGYVGDDLCNQVLTASYRCKKQTVCRAYVLHNDMEKSLASKIRFRNYDRKISTEATDILTVSAFTRDRIINSSYISKNIQVIYNGLTIKNSLDNEQKRKKINIELKKNNILMIGNFLTNKGHLKFIEAAEILLQKDRNYCFTIIGNVYDKEFFDACMKAIQEKNLTDHFSIYQGIHNAAEYIDLFDVLVVPSLFDESFGLISVEAMANGVPVVAFACGGIPEVVEDGRDGFIVPVGDSKAMADKIRWLEDHPYERESIGKNCKEDYISRLSPGVMIKKYWAIINKYL